MRPCMSSGVMRELGQATFSAASTLPVWSLIGTEIERRPISSS